LLQSIHVMLSNILQSTNNVAVNTKEGSRAIVGAVENTSVRAAAIANAGPRSYIGNRNTRGSVPA